MLTDSTILSAGLLETKLVRAGVSAGGARECLAGQPLSLLADRQLVAAMARQGLDFTTEEKTSAISLIYPAVQSARATSSRSVTDGTSNTVLLAETLELQHVGFTVSGAVELLSARPLADSQDRALLASLVAATLNH
jgi:hypothetical protein